MINNLQNQIDFLDSAAQEAELDRRLDEYLANPDDVFTWDTVKAELMAKIGQKD